MSDQNRKQIEFRIRKKDQPYANSAKRKQILNRV